MAELVTLDSAGLRCELGGFHLDPWQPVERAVLTHLHGDHARPGSRKVLCPEPAVPLARQRLPDSEIEGLPYGQPIALGGLTLSFHPSGHILGAAQVRLERRGEVWAISGDYKRSPDPTCPPFEPVRCHTFVTEATFGLPIYRWEPTAQVLRELLGWWRDNRDHGIASVVFCYALGKAQRLLAELRMLTDEPAYAHGAVVSLTRLYRAAGVRMLSLLPVAETRRGADFAGALVLAPPSARATPWTKRFGDYSSALVSGWMRVRGMRRRRGVDRGFALSDHADWPALLDTVRETGAERVLVTHGYAPAFARYLRDQGVEARALDTPYAAEEEA